MTEAIGIMEVIGLGPSMVTLDTMAKTADVRLLQVELNDYYGTVVKIAGSTAAIQTAIEAGCELVEHMGGQCTSTVLTSPDDAALPGIMSGREYQPLIHQDVVFFPNEAYVKEPTVATSDPFAVGLIETQGFTAVIEGVDTAIKAANVEVIAKEKLGGGYVTVVLKGDVAAVTAAVEAGRAAAESIGTIISAHVIARPSPAILSLLTPVES